MSSREIHEVEVDRSILARLYQCCGGPSWARSTNWLTGVPLSQWWGVTVGDRGRVVGLALRRNGLTGFLPDVLGNLRRLQELDLSGNRLNEPQVGFGDLFKWTPAQIRRVGGKEGIPVQLGDLTSLRLLNLSGNMFHWPIPATLGKLSVLEVLDLHDNYLDGTVPVELGNLANLRELDLSDNRLDVDSQVFSGLASLQRAELGNQRLQKPGEIRRLYKTPFSQ
jgi:Leucine-rich repeat (LRR) protein